MRDNKPNRLFGAVVAAAAVTLVASFARHACAQDAKPKEAQMSSPALTLLGKLVGGEWVAHAATPGGHAVDAMVSYEWGVNHKFVKSQSFMLQGKKRTLLYESVYAWHPGRKETLCYSLGGDGGMFEGTVAEKDGDLEFRFTAYEAGAATDYRQTFHLVGDSEYVWTLYRKSGDEWTKMTETPLRRRASPRAA